MNSTPTKTRNARKLIMIPEYKPLFAMAKCFGPTKGPLEKPTPVTIPVIGELLKQSGRDAVTVLEVTKIGMERNKPIYSMPVQLTLENYTLPYEEIKAGKTMSPETTAEPVDLTSAPVKPNVVKSTGPRLSNPVKSVGTGKHIVHEISDPVGVPDKVDIKIEVPAPVGVKVPKTPDMEVPEPEIPAAPNDDEKIAADVATEEEEYVPSPEAQALIDEAEAEAQAAIAEQIAAGETITEADEEEPAAPAEPVVEEEQTPVEETAPERKLTKAERKAQRRAERAQMAQNDD